MKTVELKVEDYLYTFYEKVAARAGRTTEQVKADALFRFAGAEVRTPSCGRRVPAGDAPPILFCHGKRECAAPGGRENRFDEQEGHLALLFV